MQSRSFAKYVVEHSPSPIGWEGSRYSFPSILKLSTEHPADCATTAPSPLIPRNLSAQTFLFALARFVGEHPVLRAGGAFSFLAPNLFRLGPLRSNAAFLLL